MRPEQRGQVKRLYSAFNWKQEETDECNKTICHRQVAGVRGLQSCQSQCGSGGGGSAVDRGFRDELEGQSLQDLESNVFRQLFSPTGQSGRHSEKEWRGADFWWTDCGRVRWPAGG